MDKRRRTKQSRKYQGDEFGNGLASWLNANPEDGDAVDFSQGAKNRVLRIIQKLRALRALTAGEPVGDWKHKPKRVSAREREVNKLLAEYPTVNGFEVNDLRPMVWQQFAIGIYRDPLEAWMVQNVVDLDKLGLLERIRQCSCGLFFFARFTHQTSHADSCRKKLYEQDPKRILKRRENARKYYWQQKNTNVR